MRGAGGIAAAPLANELDRLVDPLKTAMSFKDPYLSELAQRSTFLALRANRVEQVCVCAGPE
jgi:hypothetical protein